MDQDREAVKRKIILATIACIEKDGVHSMTTRSVAKEAGVNIAAINYYFGSKDSLLESTFNFTTSHFLNDLNAVMSRKDLGAYTLLKVTLAFFFHGTAVYPNMIKAFLANLHVYSDYGECFTRVFNDLLTELTERVKEEAPNYNEKSIKLFLLQAFSAVLIPEFPRDLFQVFSNFDFNDPAFKNDYITSLLGRYITWVNPSELEKQNEQADALIKNILESEASLSL